MKASDDGVEMVRRIRESARHQPESALTAALADLNELVRDSINWTEDYIRAALEERGARIEFETNLAPELAPVRAIASELREVFTNLLRNAVDAISGEGKIRVESGINSARDRNVVTVSDTGEGLSAEAMEKLFHPLFTTKGERGTGLGLATCYAIVRRHGGDIEATSEIDRGTTFTVRLPFAPK
jgi:signal transduction histidine kinase